MSPRETEWERRKRRDRERDEHVAAHGPGCQICGTVPKRGGLHQDHDHKTHRTRGWLDHRCNRALPSWVTPLWLVRAAIYLMCASESQTSANELALRHLHAARIHLDRP